MSRSPPPPAAPSSKVSKSAKAATPPVDDGLRVIKKYPNRRMYDTANSSYITLAQVRQLVMDRERFVVRDAKSGDDLTRSILLQIILEEESGGLPLFSCELLSSFVRFYGSAMQGMLGKYLENNMRTFVDCQHKLQEQSRSIYGSNSHMEADFWAKFLNFQQPAMQSMMATYMDQSKAMFQQMQDKLQNQTRNMFTTFPLAGKPEKVEK